MPRARQAASRFGHSSLSTNPAASGRQWSRKRATQARHVERHEAVQHPPLEPELRQAACASSRAEVTVPVVNSTVRSGARCGQRLQHRQDRHRLADAGRVQPEQPARRAWRRLDAAPLRQPRRHLLAPRRSGGAASAAAPARRAVAAPAQIAPAASAHPRHNRVGPSAACVQRRRDRGHRVLPAGTRHQRSSARTPARRGRMAAGWTMRSQLGSTQRRVVCAAQGSTGTPDNAASCATPAAACRRGPRGPSGVMHDMAPLREQRGAGRAARPRRRARMEPSTTSIPKRRTTAADEAAVAVAADQHMLRMCRPAIRASVAPVSRAWASSAGVHARRRRSGADHVQRVRHVRRPRAAIVWCVARKRDTNPVCVQAAPGRQDAAAGVSASTEIPGLHPAPVAQGSERGNSETGAIKETAAGSRAANLPSPPRSSVFRPLAASVHPRALRRGRGGTGRPPHPSRALRFP